MDFVAHFYDGLQPLVRHGHRFESVGSAGHHKLSSGCTYGILNVQIHDSDRRCHIMRCCERSMRSSKTFIWSDQGFFGLDCKAVHNAV